MYNIKLFICVYIFEFFLISFLYLFFIFIFYFYFFLSIQKTSLGIFLEWNFNLECKFWEIFL
jgi:hypothetical protein